MKRKLMKKLLCMLLACVMALGLQIPALAEETQETAPAWNFSVTYVEADSSFTEGVNSSDWMEQLAIAAPQSNAENFLGWGSLPNGEVQYAPGAAITLMSANRHAILYAIYGSADDNLFEIVYHVGEHTRRELFRSAENAYTATIAAAYAEGFKGWSLTEGSQKVDYMPGDTVQLAPRSTAAQDKVETTTPSLTLYAVLENENTSYLFAVHYHVGGGVKTVEQESDSVVVYFTLEGGEGVIGWSLTPGGPVSFAPGAEVCLQYNQPQLTLYAVYEEGKAPKPIEEPVEDETEEPEAAAVWSAADESIATVDQTGKVTAVSAGTTYVTVVWQEQSASIPVTVKEKTSLPLVRSLDNDGVHALKSSSKIPSNAIVKSYLPADIAQQEENPTATAIEIVYYWCYPDDGGEQMYSNLNPCPHNGVNTETAGHEYVDESYEEIP